MSDEDLYVTSFYFTITTITTVGFGDVSPGTSLEKLFGIIVMCGGVIGFSFATGSLSSLMNNLDSASAAFKARLSMLE